VVNTVVNVIYLGTGEQDGAREDFSRIKVWNAPRLIVLPDDAVLLTQQDVGFITYLFSRYVVPPFDH
jgi:hypothetical protein